VQAFDDGVLHAMGRLHTAAEARAAVQAARAAGYRSVSLDLLLGWPGESVARWRAGLDAALALEVDHLSLYILEVEGRTLLVHRARHGQLELPDDDLVADLYALTLEHLASAGLARYEISNFARPGHASRHNGKYWDDAPFLGFGLSAHSFRHGRRWWNQASFGAYTRALESGGAAAARAGERVPTEAQRVGEALFTGLRRVEGVELPAFRTRFGVDPLERYAASLRDAFAAGLLEVVGQRLRLTTRGVLLSNEVFQSFVELPAVTRSDHANAVRARG
jgi:oxygen-independent coproporphyrinogen-3 oxidase